MNIGTFSETAYHLEKSELAQHAYEEGHMGGWDEARILEIESNSRYRKYKESAHIASLNNPISNPVWPFLLSGSPGLSLLHEIPTPFLSYFQGCTCFIRIFNVHCPCYPPFTKPGLRYLHNYSYTDIHFPVIEVSSF
jgi:hypothetical protein